MEYLGDTRESVYTCPIEGRGAEKLKKEQRDVLPWATKTWSTCLVPWRPSVYRLPPQFSCAAPKSRDQPNQQESNENPELIQMQAQQPFQDYGATAVEEPRCCPDKNSAKGFHVPFRRELVGGNLKILPEKDGSSMRDFSKQLRVQGPGHAMDRKPPTLPVHGVDPDMPFTHGSACDRAAQLNEYIYSRSDQAKDRIFLRMPCHPAYREFMPNSVLPTHEEIEEHVKKLGQCPFKTKTPMSQFQNDDRFLKQTVRTYKRDTELQKERGTFEDPKRFLDEGDRDWYNSMMCNDARLDTKTESALLRSECVRVPDGLGGYCYICPATMQGRQKLKDDVKAAGEACPVDPMCCNLKTTGGNPPTKQKVIQNEIDDTIRDVNQLVKDREALYEKLMGTEQPLHDTKQAIYSLPPSERLHANDRIQQLSLIERCQHEIVNQIRDKGRKISELLKHQHTLECHLTQQIVEDSKQKMYND